MVAHGKEKEIAAVGISVATGCKPCTDFHVKAAREAGASSEEIENAIRIAVKVRERATEIMAEHAFRQLGESGIINNEVVDIRNGNRLDELVTIGAAFGVNCVSTLDEHLKSASEAGISAEEVSVIARLAVYIKKRASSHVERLCAVTEE